MPKLHSSEANESPPLPPTLVDEESGRDHQVDVRLLGGFRLLFRGVAIEPQGQRQMSLLAYLALHAGRPVTRSEVAFALWPDSSEKQALTNLRGEIHLLRRTLPQLAERIRLDVRVLEWPLTLLRVDAREFEAALDRSRTGDWAALAQAVALYAGNLVPACYDEWIEPERERLRTEYLGALDEFIDDLEGSRRYREASIQLQRRVALEPLHEPAYVALMRVASLAGDRSTALKAYHAAAAALGTELGTEPGPELRTMYERLTAAQVAAASAAPEEGPAALPLIGRDRELATLARATRRATARQVAAVVSGEPGIGKTRLMEELLQWCRAQGIATAYARCYEAEGGLAFGPIAEWLRSRPIRPRVEGVAAPLASEIARIVPELLGERRDLSPPGPMTQRWQRRALFEALVAPMRRLTPPVLLVLDDAQWADRETLEWVHYLMRADPPAGCLVVVGLRTDEEQDNVALVSLLRALRTTGGLVELTLGRLSEPQTARLAAEVSGRTLEPEEASTLYGETDGHPLFVVEVARSSPGRWTRTPGADASDVPPRVHEVIATRLAQLSTPARATLEIAATIGRGFDTTILSGASELEEPALVDALDELWRRQLIRTRGFGGYDFAHDRIRDVAYRYIAPARRALLHRRVARSIEATHAVDLDPVRAQLAAHHEAAGLIHRAIDDYEQAARVAAAVSAHVEAADHLSRAIQLLREGSHTATRDRRELELLSRLAASLTAVRGWASDELSGIYDRARDLAEAVHSLGAQIDALMGLYGIAIVGGRIRQGHEYAGKVAARARRAVEFVPGAHLMVGGALLHLGRPHEAVGEFDLALRHYRPGPRSRVLSSADTAVFAAAWGSHALWLLGDDERAAAWSVEAIDRGADLEPFERALAETYAATLEQLRQDVGQMREHLSIALELCARYEIGYYGAWCDILGGWADRKEAGDGAIGRIESAVRSLDTLGARIRRPYFLSLLADAMLANGRRGEARETLASAVRLARADGEEWWTAELLRQAADLEPGDRALEGKLLALRTAARQGALQLAVRCLRDLMVSPALARDAVDMALAEWHESNRADAQARLLSLTATARRA